jgi:stage II sporulation protein D
MIVIIKRNFLYFISITLFLVFTALFLFYPRSVEHGLLINNGSKYSTFYIDGKLKRFRTPSLVVNKTSVLNFKYNLFRAYGFKEVPPIKDRVMTKNSDSYELEASGFFNLSKVSSFYELDKNNKLTPVKSRKIIVGKRNVTSYKDSKGRLKTFIISPMDYSDMRVGISTTNFTSLYHNKIDFTALAASKVYSLRDKFELDIYPDSIMSIEKVDDKLSVVIKNPDGPPITKETKERLYISSNSITLNSISRGAPSFTPNYSGIIEVTPNSNGLLMINEVNLEEYLKKVVPSEMPAYGALEALKCQAVAARTYAISDMILNRYANLGFYVDDSTQSQVYNNVPTHGKTTDAVNATKGLIMTYKGTPIDAKYYSTSAGTGVTYKDIWFNSDRTSDYRPYFATQSYVDGKSALPITEEGWLDFYKDTSLKAVDSSSPYFRWRIEFTNEALTNSLHKSIKSIYERKKDFLTIRQNNKLIYKLPELKSLKDIKILERSEGGNLLKIAFIFDNAEVEVLGDYNIRGIIRCSKEFAGTTISVERYNSTPLTSMNYLPSSFFSIEKSGDNFILYGGGYGHGVGMSQYGAMSLGKEGKDFRTILNTFYKDITLTQIY